MTKQLSVHSIRFSRNTAKHLVWSGIAGIMATNILGISIQKEETTHTNINVETNPTSIVQSPRTSESPTASVPQTHTLKTTHSDRPSFPDFSSTSGFFHMPSDLPGCETYGESHKRFAKKEVIQTLFYLCHQWHQRYPQGPRIGIGNISLEQGGPIYPHTSHQQGIDVDFSPFRNDAQELPVTWNNPTYSRPLTEELIKLLHESPHTQVQFILFNDPEAQDVKPYPGHDDHLHIRFQAAN